MAQVKRTELTVRLEKVILVGVIFPDTVVDHEAPLEELARLGEDRRRARRRAHRAEARQDRFGLLHRQGQGQGDPRAREGARRGRGYLRPRLEPRAAAKPRGGRRHEGGRPQRTDPRHLRHPRAHRDREGAGGAGAAGVHAAAAHAHVVAPRAPRRRHRHARPRRAAAGDRPADRAPPHLGLEAPPRGGRAPEDSARSGAARTNSPSASSATPTPASRRS